MNENNRIVRFGLTALITVGGLLGLISLLPALEALWDIGSEIFNTAAKSCYPTFEISCVVAGTVNGLTNLAGVVAYLWLVFTGLEIGGNMPSTGLIYFNLINQAVTFGALALTGIALATVGTQISRLTDRCFK